MLTMSLMGSEFGHGGMSALSPFYPQLRTLVDAAGHGSFVLIREVAIGLPHLMPERYGRCGRRRPVRRTSGNPSVRDATS